MNHHVRDRENFTQILEFTPGMRRLIADAVEALILLLDEIDGDGELEEDEREDVGDDEPTLGAMGVTNQAHWGRAGFQAADECELCTDTEPSMGSMTGRDVDQTEWGRSWPGFIDEAEPGVDTEPLHGSGEVCDVPRHIDWPWGAIAAQKLAGFDQRGWALGQSDFEADHDGLEPDVDGEPDGY